MSKSYSLNLPVFKQGDDFGHHLEQTPKDIPAAFLAQAECYEEAARICKQMAGVASELPNLSVDANTHYIGIFSDDTNRLAALAKDGLLTEDEWEDEDEEWDESDASDDSDLDEGDDSAGNK